MTSHISLVKSEIVKFLRWSERYTKIDMVYFTASGFWVNLAYVLNLVLTTISAIVFANYLPREIYGNYKYVLSIAAVLGSFVLTGMNTAVTRATARGYEGTLRKSFILQIRWGLLFFIMALALAGYYCIKDNTTIAVSLLIIGLFFPLANSANTYVAYLQGKKAFKINFYYTFSGSLINFVFIIVAVFYRPDVIGLVFAYFFSQLAANLYFYSRTLKKFNPVGESDPEAMKYGKHLSFLNLFSNVATNLDKILVFHYLGAVDLAIYLFATLIPENLHGLFKFIGTIILPKYASKTDQETGVSVRKNIFKFICATILLFILYILAAPIIYKYIFPQYIDALPYSQVFALILIAAVSYLPTTALLSQGLNNKLYKFSTVSPIFSVLATFFLIYFYGLWGAVIAKILSHFFNLFYSTYLVSKNYGRSNQ